MKKLTLAQELLIALGVDHVMVVLGHHKERSPSYTKKGPGRIHQQGKKSAA